MTIAIGIVLVALSVVMIRHAKAKALAGQNFWKRAANSEWLPILFTGLFGFGVVATFGGIVQVITP